MASWKVKFLAISFLLFLPTGESSACTIDLALNQLRLDFIQDRGDVAAKDQKVLAELSLLNSRASLPNVPLNKQLSPADIKRFQMLREQLLKSNMRSLYLSWFERDVAAISEASKMTELLERNIVIKENDPRSIYMSIVVLLKVQLEKNQLSLPQRKPTDSCDMDHALSMLQGFQFTQINIDEAMAAFKRIENIARRYGSDPSDPGLLNKIRDRKDREIAEHNLNMAVRARKVISHIKDLENLRNLYWLARERLTIHINELNTLNSEAEMKRVGQAWKSRVERFSESEKSLNFALLLIEKSIPSDKDLENSARR